MEAIKLPETTLTVVPAYRGDQLRMQLGRARSDNEGLRYKISLLQEQLTALRMEVQRLTIENNLKADQLARLSELATAAEGVKPRPKLPFRNIVSLVCAYREVSLQQLQTPGRKRGDVYSRNLCFYLGYLFGRDGVVYMGNYFNRDHSMTACGRQYIEDKLPIYDDVRQDVEYLTGKIKDIIAS